MLSRRLLILFLCVPYAYVILVRGQKDNAPQIETDDASDNRRLRKSSLPIVKFYALGDGPYGYQQRQRFPSQLKRMDSRPEFAVHLGNVRERQQDCDSTHLDQAANALINNSKIPTFVLPGEADWYTCKDQESAWAGWSRNFLRFEDNWNHNLPVRHQDGTPENFSFIHKGVLFCSFHVLNASILNVEIWNEKVKANVRWLESELVSNAFQNDVGAIVLLAHAQPHTRRYREFYESLLIVSSQIDKPIMYLHGAEKQFSVERDFSVHNILSVSIARGRWDGRSHGNYC